MFHKRRPHSGMTGRGALLRRPIRRCWAIFLLPTALAARWMLSWAAEVARRFRSSNKDIVFLLCVLRCHGSGLSVALEGLRDQVGQVK